MNRQRIILAGLLAALALSLIYAYIATPRLEQAPPRATDKPGVATDETSADPDSENAPERINFDYMVVKPQQFPGAERDIFRYVARRPVRTEPPPVAIAPTPVARPVVPPPVVPLAVVQKELSKFTFLGFLEKAGEKIVFLSSSGNLFLASRGESFGVNREFRVADIDDKLLKVSRVGNEDLIEIPLIEQQQLTASVRTPSRTISTPGRTAFSRTQSLPQRRMLRPQAPQMGEQTTSDEQLIPDEQAVPGMIDENNPEGQDGELPPPIQGDATEGDVNGTNQ
jgi:hypothetical protein